MSTILVIGASGFLGRYLVSCCPGARKVGTYHLHASMGLEFLDLQDSRQIQEIIKRLAPSVVIYAAGLTDVDACERNPQMAWRLNTHAIAEAASCSAARIVYLSTDYAFDGLRGLYCEEDEPRPVNIYGQTKVAGERTILARSPGNLVVRVSGLYDGEGIKGCGFSKPIVPNITDDIRLSSPIHVDDVVLAIQRLLDSDTGGIYHVAGPDALSRYEFWQLVALHHAGEAVQLERPETATLRPRDSSLSTQRMQSLGWQARSVCQRLPPLKSIPRGMQSSSPTDRQRNEPCEGLLIDCVGGLLTRRNWLPEVGTVAEIDSACADAMDGPEFWQTTAHSRGLEESDISNLQEQVTLRYAPNPPVWANLRRWRAQYRLALVNNGTSATFRRWVQKYGLDQVFDVLANSEEMGMRKPDPEFFLRVAKDLGIRSDRCVLIDDDKRNIDGARRSGLRALQTHELGNYPISIHAWNGSEARALSLGVDLDG